MPEGHTLHRLARDHHTWFAGEPVTLSSPQGRFTDGAARLSGLPLREATAVGKHLLYRFDDAFIHIHLGLFGRFRWVTGPPRDTVRLRIETATRGLDLTGPTDCAVWTAGQVQALRDRLGPDPLDPGADKARFAHNLSRRRRPIGATLLDQKVVAGIGNVYRAELLFLCRIDPSIPSRELGPSAVDHLWSEMLRLLPIGVKTNRIITTDPADFDKTLSRMTRRDSLWVYKRSRCRVCGTAISKATMGSRTLYWCPECQR